eukprot:s1972_g2.t1
MESNEDSESLISQDLDEFFEPPEPFDRFLAELLGEDESTVPELALQLQRTAREAAEAEGSPDLARPRRQKSNSDEEEDLPEVPLETKDVREPTQPRFELRLLPYSVPFDPQDVPDPLGPLGVSLTASELGLLSQTQSFRRSGAYVAGMTLAPQACLQKGSGCSSCRASRQHLRPQGPRAVPLPIRLKVQEDPARERAILLIPTKSLVSSPQMARKVQAERMQDLCAMEGLKNCSCAACAACACASSAHFVKTKCSRGLAETDEMCLYSVNFLSQPLLAWKTMPSVCIRCYMSAPVSPASPTSQWALTLNRCIVDELFNEIAPNSTDEGGPSAAAVPFPAFGGQPQTIFLQAVLQVHKSLVQEGVAEEWDGCEDVRARLRDGGNLIHPEALQDDVQGCCFNSSLLVPLLTRMSLKDGKPLPPIDELRGETEKTYHKNKRGMSPEDQDEIVKAAWRVKKMLGFVKMKVRREEVSTELPEEPNPEEDEWDEEAKSELKGSGEGQGVEKDAKELHTSNPPNPSSSSDGSKPSEATPEGAGNSEKKSDEDKTGPSQETKQDPEIKDKVESKATPEINQEKHKPSDAKPESTSEHSQSSAGNQPNKTHQPSEVKQPAVETETPPSKSNAAAKDAPSTLVALCKEELLEKKKEMLKALAKSFGAPGDFPPATDTCDTLPHDATLDAAPSSLEMETNLRNRESHAKSRLRTKDQDEDGLEAPAAEAAEEVGGNVSGWKRMHPGMTHIGNMLMGLVGTGMIPLTMNRAKSRNQNDKGKPPNRRHPRRKKLSQRNTRKKTKSKEETEPKERSKKTKNKEPTEKHEEPEPKKAKKERSQSKGKDEKEEGLEKPQKADENKKRKKESEGGKKRKQEDCEAVSLPDPPSSRKEMKHEILDFLLNAEHYTEENAKEKLKADLQPAKYVKVGFNMNIYWTRRGEKGVGSGVTSRAENKDVRYILKYQKENPESRVSLQAVPEARNPCCAPLHPKRICLAFGDQVCELFKDERWDFPHYPMPFARAVVDMLEEMKAHRRGCPQLPAVVPPFQEALDDEIALAEKPTDSADGSEQEVVTIEDEPSLQPKPVATPVRAQATAPVATAPAESVETGSHGSSSVKPSDEGKGHQAVQDVQDSDESQDSKLSEMKKESEDGDNTVVPKKDATADDEMEPGKEANRKA